MPAADHLRYLAGFVDAIEINNTFYRPPETSDVARWLSQVADIPDFRFTVKLWQRFTHAREEATPADLADFLTRIRPLFDSSRGGALLAQFPHSFHYEKDNAEYLESLLSRIERIPVAVEVRHQSWNNPEAMSLLRNAGASMCSIDQPRVSRDSLGPLEEVTSEIAYIRLHGRNRKNWFSAKAGRDERYDYLYNHHELEPWADRTLRFAEKAREVYAIANNHFRGQEVCNALMLKSMLLKQPVHAPAKLLESFPALRGYVVPDAPVQETLF
jgi:uncharacterized protein YecE (DUF72 family)